MRFPNAQSRQAFELQTAIGQGRDFLWARLVNTPVAPQNWREVPGAVGIEFFRGDKLPPAADTAAATGSAEAADSAAPLIVYVHGGGYSHGSVSGSYAYIGQRLARGSGCAVASIEYRLAPEHPYPAALDDIETSLEWLVREGGAAASLNIRTDRFALVGDSAGGGLIAATMLRLKARNSSLLARIATQVLIYPWLQLDVLTEHKSQLAHSSFPAIITLHSLAHMAHAYAGGADPSTRANPFISPIRATKDMLRGLPPAVVITAGFDPLADEGKIYAGMLEAAGVPTNLRHYPNTVHGFVASVSTTDHEEGLDDVFSAVRKHVLTH